MMEFARGKLESRRRRSLRARLVRWLGLRVVLPSRLALRLTGALLRFAQLTGLIRVVAPGVSIPRVPPTAERRLLPPRIAAEGGAAEEALGPVYLLQGCVMPELLPRTNRATASVLTKLGHEVRVPEAAVCCGSLHAHNGDLEGARRQVMELARAFPDGPLVMNSAGCGAHLAECAELFAPDDPRRPQAAALAARVVDFSVFVARRLDELEPDLDANAWPGPVAWDDPCHLCHAQGVRAEPRAILDAIAGLERRELPDAEACCGSAGVYSMLRPADAEAVFAGKLAAWRKSGARTLVTSNPGCQLQWAAGLRAAGDDAPVVHVAELLDRALP
jgi:glycolate oxidase iron-sulfur subunit